MFKNFFSKKKLIIIFLIIIFVLLNIFGLLKPINRAWQNLLSYSSNQFSFLLANNYNCPKLESEINNLQTRLESITIDKAELKILREENQQLKDYFNFNETNDYELILVEVISKQAILGLREKQQNLIINQGLDHGLEIGLAVSNQAGIIIGKIVAIKEKSAEVCLITNNNCQIAASILNNDKTLGISSGQLGLTVFLDMIPQTEQIEIGDIVVSSGLEALIPRGLVIGQVNKVETKSNEIWQTAIIEPAFSLNNLNILAVVKP